MDTHHRKKVRVQGVKLPAHGAGLPGKEVSFILCPPWSGLIDLIPPIPLWREGARSGQVVKGSSEDWVIP